MTALKTANLVWPVTIAFFVNFSYFSSNLVQEPMSTPASLIDVSWDEACDTFDGLYLNWDPALFEHSREFHGSWRTKAGDHTPQCK